MTLTYVYWGVSAAAGLALLLIWAYGTIGRRLRMQKQKDQATEAWRNAISIDME